jgi:adrenodoxin-NADP+ reductase
MLTFSTSLILFYDDQNVMNKFDEVATDDRFRFLGNVHVGGQELPLAELKPHYDAIVFSYGASEDRRLNIPGEDLKNVFSARAFVGWYNGLPLHRDLQPDLDNTDTAVVVGQGNVALDIARMLLSPIDELRKTDLTAYALEALSKSRIKHVHVVGRRGPLQVCRNENVE